MFKPEFDPQKIEQLQERAIAAELNLTFSQQRSGKESELYQESMNDFIRAWTTLLKTRHPAEFLPEGSHTFQVL
jgi:hypothetical protein